LKKTIVILMLALAMLLAGCAPIVLNIADAAGLADIEAPPLLPEKPVPDPEYTTSEPAAHALIEETITLTNEQRSINGCASLAVSDRLCRIAQLRACDMAEKGYFDHVSPSGENVFTMLHEYNVFYIKSGENIALGDVSAEKIVQLWMESPTHRENLLSNGFCQIGIGVAEAADGKKYWVQVFTS